MEYNTGKTDEELVALARSDRQVMELLCEKYKPLVLKLSKSLYLIGGETDDLIQEGMMGLFSAIMTYDESREASFLTFATVIVQRQLIKAIENANRKKNGPLNSYVSLSGGEEEEAGLFETSRVYPVSDGNPEDEIIGRESRTDIIERISAALSPMEKEVFELYIEGNNYRQIAQKMGKPAKNIDNALTRIRNKAKRVLPNQNS